MDERWLSARIDHVSVRFPFSATPGDTWVLVGSDRRTGVDPSFGTAADVPGDRADVVLVVHREGGRVHVISVPRDLLLRAGDGTLVRTALTWAKGAQQLVDGLCRTLGIAATRLAVLTMPAFATLVDAAGGITVSIPVDVRDPAAGLDLGAGRRHLSGAQALALVRSRHPQYRVDGRWVGTSEVTGAVTRTTEAGTVFTALQKKMRGVFWHPVRLQRLADAATTGLTTDPNTGLLDLLQVRVSAPVEVLPSDPLPNGVATISNARTRSVLTAAGFGRPCAASS